MTDRPTDLPRVRRRVVVVGGGIAGLTAAHRLATAAPPGTTVTLLEGGPAPGGKLRAAPLAGVPVDEGAESLLNRVPEAVALARAVGLAGDLVYPATTSASVWTRGALRPIPAGTVMGVPADLAALDRSGVLSATGLLRLPLDAVLPRTRLDGDVSVGWYVGRRLGREVVDRLVDPLLGGVYAGRADELSLAATVPALAAATRRHRTLVGAARAARAASAHRPDTPVFAGVRGGVGRFAAAVADASAAAGARIRTGMMVRALRPAPGGGGWCLPVGGTRDEQVVEADAVLVAVPARPAARLLRDVAPAAAADLGAVDYASMALVTYAFEAGSVCPPAGSGFLVPAVEGRLVKAATFLSAKWPWLREAAPGLEFVRCSVGRHGEEGDVQRDDADLVGACRAELAEVVGGQGRLVEARVSRWGGGLPQYAVGHRDRVERVRAALAPHPTLELAGAAYDGIGVAACVRTAAAAADRLLAALDRGERIEA